MQAAFAEPQIRRPPEPATPAPRALGVDEFALCKGHSYGAILIDIETRHPVDLLPDPPTATVAKWLADHPGVEVICRDHSTAFAEAGRLDAPDAIHVADRRCIWENLAESVEKPLVHRLGPSPGGSSRLWQCSTRPDSRRACASAVVPGTGRAAAITRRVSASTMSCTFAEAYGTVFEPCGI